MGMIFFIINKYTFSLDWLLGHWDYYQKWALTKPTCFLLRVARKPAMTVAGCWAELMQGGQPSREGGKSSWGPGEVLLHLQHSISLLGGFM